MEFVGRKDELQFLQEKYDSKRAELIIVYGRRRLGKTMLLKKSLENKGGFYFLMTNDTPSKNLESFKEILSETLNQPLIKEVQDDTWDNFFRKIQTLLPNNYTIILDEIPYLFSQQKSIISQFQKLYDEYFKEKNIKLVLCGSSLSIMDEISSYSSPLYGRRTGKIHLKSFTIVETKEFLKSEDLEEVLKYHLLFGGVPYYLEQIDTKKSFDENIETLFFSKTTIFDDEVQFLLKEEFREIRNYISIIRAIARGRNTYSLISNSIDLNSSSLSAYLISLENLNIIAQKISFFDKQNSKKVRYEIEDNFLYIWFNVFEKYKKQLLSKEVQKIIIQETLFSQLGFLFEKECRKILQLKAEKVGSFFTKQGVEIDIVTQNNQMYNLYECKFQKNVSEKKLVAQLKEKSQYLPKSVQINSYNVISIDKGITLKNLFGYYF